MEIYVMNSVIDLWRKYDALRAAFNTLNMKREVLGEQLNLRKADIDQHLVNKLRREGKPSQYDYAKETICEVVMQCKDNDAICDIYRSIHDIMEERMKKAEENIHDFNVTNDTADVDGKIEELSRQAEAFRNEVIAHREHIEKMNNRSWWQRLFNIEPK